MAMTHRTLFPPPDEKRALEQLEKLHREILRARRDRERAGTEFEGFVQELRDQPEEGAPAATVERSAHRAPRPIATPPEPAQAPAPTPHAAPTPAVAPMPAPAPPHATSAKPQTRVVQKAPTAMPARAAAPAGGQRTLLLVALILVVAAAAAFYFWQQSQRSATPQQAGAGAASQASSSSSSPQPAGPGAATVPPPAPAAPAAPPVSPSTVQLTTDRPVWMRVIVDGQKILEREIPAGQHLTYNPNTFISVRAGDAGGVRVKVGNGPEQVLGRDAFPVTRRFDVGKR